MPDTTDRLSRRWLHSFEEDHEGIQVYRPSGHPFPPARGRAGIEFRPDGTFLDLPVGRGDANEVRPCRWYREPRGPVHVHAGSGEPRIMEVLHLEPDRLEVQWRADAR
jgi:hypothetical protein